ncbi:MAG: sigma 54-interacting transcriptional regulator [Clostridiaceae bacterium]|nr:sigma 54-interacting transcriptional regulator [Clostridiaceae bacterium]MBW4860432.1 sigma 54-interacting transcriptional regulator [Clostridiaceae bacterium]MBW4868348.1 sigma 54-interacting transcriptional regulator [Clostridiaceae bacterium]
MSKKLEQLDMEYVDAIMIIDHTGKIVYSVRYNPRFDDESKLEDFKDIIDKNILEVYPTLDVEESTIINCLKHGIPKYEDNQVFYDYKGRVYNTQNLTLPIIKSGKILGAIEISKDITRIEKLSDKNKKSIQIPSKENNKNNRTIAKYNFEDILTKNKGMKENIYKCKMVADSISSVLVYGETGTGKELFVQSIHNYSYRKNKPFIAQNCAALPESLFESILFGSVKGSFTGAIDKPGLFEQANGGTLFLDEINSMPINLQAKLLRVLQDGYVRRVGDSKDRKVDVRIMAAMNEEPMEALEKGHIREDLLYRLNVVSIKLVPLRERKEDISLYVNLFIKKYNEKLNKNVSGISKEVERIFYEYNWPGNVRELQHIIEASINMVYKDLIEVRHLPIYLSENIENRELKDNIDEIKPLNEAVEELEKRMIINSLKKTDGNISKASNYLSIPRQTLHYKINKYNIEVNRYVK